MEDTGEAIWKPQKCVEADIRLQMRYCYFPRHTLRDGYVMG